MRFDHPFCPQILPRLSERLLDRQRRDVLMGLERKVADLYVSALLAHTATVRLEDTE